jgi:hypothetical protein
VNLKKYKCGGYSLFPMFNKHTTALCAIVISSLVVASVFAISFVQQQASAQGNQTSGVGGSSRNQTGSNSTSGGAAAGGGTTGTSGGNRY